MTKKSEISAYMAYLRCIEIVNACDQREWYRNQSLMAQSIQDAIREEMENNKDDS